MPHSYQLTVNGEARDVDVPPDTPLLDVLRSDLDLTAAKFGCGLGLCGSCTVLIDGRPSYACDTPVEYVGSAAVETVEGLGSEDAPHRLQSAFLELQAGQCGYCVPGILMSAAALLRENSHPTRGEVAAALDRNLCRCGTHQRFVDAVVLAAESGS
ncbi:MAG: (2Fe-2S)-binding protein [Aeromicrobium sp.]